MGVSRSPVVGVPGHQTQARELRVYGLVQGVGFRPFLHRLAARYGINGWAVNRNDCVLVHAEGTEQALYSFRRAIGTEAPPLAQVRRVTVETTEGEAHTGFEIRESRDASQEVTRVSADTAVCDACMGDVKRQANRINYPFVNCTNCGPRFSIIQDLPYDRSRTTMQSFRMCDSCSREYADISDRRYHAQPNACAICGPRYELVSDGRTTTDISAVLTTASAMIDGGLILALKGIGGFHLACDAYNEAAVRTIRRRKHREGKPLAVLCRDIDAVRSNAVVSTAEERLIASPRRPIVLLPSRRRLAPAVGNGLSTLGVMLPYTPLHYLLFRRLAADTIVLTSGNLSEEPIVVDNTAAMERLSSVADAFLLYNRDIHNRLDDSVAFVSGGHTRLVRRSRGWAPEPVTMSMEVEGIAAMGAELKTCFAIGKGSEAILSQHIGDLKNRETLEFYAESFERFRRLFRFNPQVAACDLHPDYLSTRQAEKLGVPVVPVQHHHAHVASCLAEHGVAGPVIGVALDGTGYGPDGTIWGSEFMVAGLRSYHRVGHFAYLPLPGGDAAVGEPWRIALPWLRRALGDRFKAGGLPEAVGLPEAARGSAGSMVLAMVDRNINTPASCGAGRYFDAVAAALGLVETAAFEAEAPMRLEALISSDSAASCGSYGVEVHPQKDENRSGGLLVCLDGTIRGVVDDMEAGVPAGVISARFHNTVVDAVVRMCAMIRDESRITTVALSGGVFQNRYLLGESERRLSEAGFAVLANRTVPANDGGICLGQMAVAAARRATDGD